MPRKLPHNINEIDDSIPKNKANPNKTNKGALLGFHKWSFETKPSDETNYFKWFLFKQTWHEPLLSLELKIYIYVCWNTVSSNYDTTSQSSRCRSQKHQKPKFKNESLNKLDPIKHELTHQHKLKRSKFSLQRQKW